MSVKIESLHLECPICRTKVGKIVLRDEGIGALGGWRISFECHPEHTIIISELAIKDLHVGVLEDDR